MVRQYPQCEDWRAALQRVVANAWLKPQEEFLDQLLSDEGTPQPYPTVDHRLVFAGLASIWHAFSLRQKSDFPQRRRVSATYTAVDSQVPGGSGLVPCMEAAAMAGPQAAGRLAFLTNVPRAWSSWDEIEEFCLSAGVDVRPHLPSEQDPSLQIGRTSYVLLWNLEQEQHRTQRPKQRFIIDVPSLADEKLANQMAELKSPKARIECYFQSPGGEDLLFADKETEIDSLLRWHGPLIFETGASGIELLGEPDKLLRPTLWTSGVGSFLRTIIVATGCLPKKEDFPNTRAEVLAILARQETLAPFLACAEASRRSYVAKLVSFECPPWSEGGKGFLYDDELTYGRWLLDEWWTVGPTTLDFLNARKLLSEAHPALGRGVLTTIHEGGLMGAWDMADDSRLLVRVGIAATEHGHEKPHLVHAITCGARSTSERGITTSSRCCAEIEISDKMNIRMDGVSQEFPLGSAARWNTLAAGDTVRGALAYGLWEYLYSQDSKPHDVAHVLFASATLATMKCYAGSFINYMNLVELMRNTNVWSNLWGSQTAAEDASICAMRRAQAPPAQ